METLSSYCITLTFAVASDKTISFHSLTPFIVAEAGLLLMLSLSIGLEKQTSSPTTLQAKRVHGSGTTSMTHGVLVNLLAVDPPYDLLLEANAVILGPHVAGKVVLILQETLGCNQSQLAACLRWNNRSHVAAIRSLVLATRNVTTSLTVACQ